MSSVALDEKAMQKAWAGGSRCGASWQSRSCWAPASSPAGPSRRRIQRFNGMERFAHWITAVSFLVLTLACAVGLAALVTRRVRMGHVHHY